MRPNCLLLRSTKTIVQVSVAIIMLAALGALAVAAVATITEKSTSDRVKHCAAGLTAHAAHGLADLTALFRQQQSLYLRIALPTPDFLLRQSCGTIAFDPQDLPADFLEGLVAATNNGCRVYDLVIAEDPVTRDIVFANGNGYEIQAVAVTADYDPWWLLESMYPDLNSGNYSSDQVAWLKRCYDPARVQVTVTLLAVDDITTYASASSDSMSAMMAGTSPMMAYTGLAVSNLQFTAIETKTNGMLLTLAYPTNFTNRVDIFTCTNLMGAYWDLAATVNVMHGVGHHAFYFVGGDLVLAITNPDETWDVPGCGVMKSDAFANYLAGYSGTYIGCGAYQGVILGGRMYAAFSPNESWRDEASIPAITAGSKAAEAYRQQQAAQYRRLPLILQIILPTITVF